MGSSTATIESRVKLAKATPIMFNLTNSYWGIGGKIADYGLTKIQKLLWAFYPTVFLMWYKVLHMRDNGYSWLRHFRNQSTTFHRNACIWLSFLIAQGSHHMQHIWPLTSPQIIRRLLFFKVLEKCPVSYLYFRWWRIQLDTYERCLLMHLVYIRKLRMIWRLSRH